MYDCLLRNRRMVALTEPGRLFLEEARRILRHLDRAIDLAQRAGRGEAGHLAIGYSAATVHSGLLSHLVGTFHRAAPDVTLTIHELHPAVQREALLTGELDVGFVVLDGASNAPEFDRCIVEHWQMVLALPANHPLAGRAAVPLNRPRDEPFISYEALGEDLGIEAFRTAAGFAPKVAHYAENPAMILALVAAGLGIATVPAVLEHSAPPGIVFAVADRPFPVLPIVALSRLGNSNAALLRFLTSTREE